MVFLQRCTDHRALENEQRALEAISRAPRLGWRAALPLPLSLSYFFLFLSVSLKGGGDGLGQEEGRGKGRKRERCFRGLVEVKSDRGAALNLHRRAGRQICKGK